VSKSGGTFDTSTSGEAKRMVVVFDCDDADQFLDRLSPRGPFFGSTEAGGSQPDLGDAWIFRGHSDDHYVLSPSALRKENSFAEFGGWKCIDNDPQIRAELAVTRQFFNLADATGLALPEDSQALRAVIANLVQEDYFKKLESGKEVWPPREIWSLLGIAQHYHVPTRLLDWTRRSFVAAYFAAKSVPENTTADGKLSVWAFAIDRFCSRFDPENAPTLERRYLQIPQSLKSRHRTRIIRIYMHKTASSLWNCAR
jgi:hypothetical protein